MATYGALVFENEEKFRVHSCCFFLSPGEPACSQAVDVDTQTSLVQCPPTTGEGSTSSHPLQHDDMVSELKVTLTLLTPSPPPQPPEVLSFTTEHNP